MGPKHLLLWWQISVKTWTWVSSFSRCLNGTIPWRKCPVKALLDAKRLFMTWQRTAFNDVNDWSLRNQIISSKLQLNMIVIDSVAGPLRSEFENVERIQRAKQIHKIGQILHQLSRILNVPIGNNKMPLKNRTSFC